MKLYFDDIIIKHKLLINKGFIDVSINGFTLITGKNGSGKTLLLKNTFLNSENNHISMVYVDQNNESILTNQTVLQNISMSCNAQRNEYIKSTLIEMGFESLLSRSSSKISGGEKRIVNLLRGFFSESTLLLMDEPTNDLDHNSVQKILLLIEKFSTVKFIVAISHDDRLVQNADTIYIVENLVLSLKKFFPDNKATNNLENSNIKSYNTDKKFVASLFKYNFVSFLFAMIFIAVLVFQVVSYAKEDKGIPLKIPDNQINLYNLLSVSINNRMFDGVYPVATIDLLYENNPITQLVTLGKVNNYLKTNRPIFFDLDIGNDECFTAYPFEFYDVANRKTYFTMDLVLQTYYATNWDISSVDTLGLFEVPYEPTYTENPEIYSVNKEQFLTCASVLKDMLSSSGQKYEIVCSVVVLNDGFTFDDFYKSAAFQKVVNGGSTFICNNNVIDIITKISQFMYLFDRIVTLFFVGITILLVDLLFSILLMNMLKQKIFTLKNYSISSDDVKSNIIRFVNNRYPKLVVFFAFFVLNLLIFLKLPFSPVNYVFTLLCAIFMAINYWCNNKASEIIVERYYKWCAR